MFQRLALFAVATLFLASLGVPAAATGKVKCGDAVAIAAVNPIEHHNQPNGEDALYNFYGNAKAANAGADYVDMISGDTTCRLPGDTAGYLVATLINTKTGDPVGSNQSTFYYRPSSGVGGPSFGKVLPYPPDTRLIGTRYNWTCGQNSGERARPVQEIPDCSGLSGGPGNTLTLHLDFPSCFDGELIRHSSSEVGNTTDNEHFAYTVQHECPSDFPIEVPALRMAIQFDWTDKPNNLEMSTGDVEGFFWNTWDQPSLVAFVQDCIDPNGDYSDRACNP